MAPLLPFIHTNTEIHRHHLLPPLLKTYSNGLVCCLHSTNTIMHINTVYSTTNILFSLIIIKHI